MSDSERNLGSGRPEPVPTPTSEAAPPEAALPEAALPEEASDSPTVEVPGLESPTVAMPALPRRPTAVPFDQPTIALPRIGIRAALDELGSTDIVDTGGTGGSRGTGDSSDSSDTAPGANSPAQGAARGTAAAAPAGIGRASGVMAIGTLASRVTGFLRTVALAAAIGTALVGDAYNVANTTPNILYDLLLGGVLTSVVVPVLARAAREDDDEGVAFASSLLTLVVIGLGVVTVLGIVAAPVLIRLYISRPDQIATATTLLRYFLPQVVFYGVGATIGAILNLRNRFAAPTVTPVLNNMIVIAVCGVFMVISKTRPPQLDTISSGELALLGIGTTTGIVVMTLALLPSLWASGFRYRPRLDLRHPGLRSAGKLAGWVLLFVITNQVSLTVITRLASAAVAYTTWQYAYQLFQLPHAIIAVSVITALLPRMSRHAADDRLDLVRTDLSTGLRLAAVVIVPAAFGLLALATPICVAIFAHGASSVSDAERIGAALAGFAVALVPFSSFQLQLRAFYALADSRTPTLINFAVAGTNIVCGVLLSWLLPERQRAVALALAFAAAYLVGSLVCSRLLVRRLSGLDTTRILRTVARSAVAGAVAALVAFLLSHAILALLGSGPSASMVAVVVAGLLGSGLYFLIAVRMRIEELTSLVGSVRSRFSG
ncbi:MAG TPA: murein biosynthesis integral membrane protein MurJ [Frankiaceae bacterium]|nr:murein biosynthesis integral membrane protein MurJ [Frankiaceae bacterium]